MFNYIAASKKIQDKDDWFTLELFYDLVVP